MSKMDLAAGFVGGVHYGKQYPDLLDFDPMKYADPTYVNSHYNEKCKQRELGRCSRVIQEYAELGRAARLERIEDLKRIIWYSMVVIDEEKHQLNRQKAFEELGIKEIFDKYL